MNFVVNHPKPVSLTAKNKSKAKAERALYLALSPEEKLKKKLAALKKKRAALNAFLESQRAKIIARDATYGLVTIKCVKRNIYLTLSDNQGRMKASMSTGYLKAKGKARRAAFFIKILAKRFTDLILKSKLKKIHYSLCGYLPRKTKRIFLRAFKGQKKKFKIYKFTRRLKTPHNGCRPSKMRRK